MAKKVPSYQTEGVPRRAPQLAPVDAGSLIETLGSFQAQAQSEAIDAASRAASGLGSRQGIEAAQGGAPQPSGRADTAAGQAFTKAARASYMGQLENDVQEVSDEFNRKWKAGEYGEDAEKWSNGFDAAISGATKGLDEETRSVYGPRIDSISNRTKKAVFDDFQERTRLSQVADVSVALDKVGDDLLGFARDGDLESLETTLAVYDQYLADGVEGRLFTDPEAITLKMDMMDNLTAEAHVGEFLEADDMRAYLDNFKEKRPSDLTPAKHEELAANMEARLKKIETEFSKQDAYAVVDSMTADEMTFGEGMDHIRETVENPNTRQNAESLWRQNKTDNERQEKIDYDVHINATYQNIVDQDVLPAEIQADPTLTGKDKAALIDYMNKKAKGDDVATNWATYAKLMDMTPAELLEETPLSYRNKLADAEFKQIVGRRTRALEAKASGEEDLDEGTTAQAITAATNQMEWTGAGNAEKRGKLQQESRLEINKKMDELARELTYAEKTETINNLLVEGRVQESFLGLDRLWRDKTVKMLDIPAADRAAIETAQKERGITNPTPDDIAKVWFGAKGEK